MTGPVVTVVYEDQGAKGQIRNFGPHRLLCAAIADQMSSDAAPLTIRDIDSRVNAVLKKGNGNVLRACRRDLHLLTRTGSPVIAVLDSDKIVKLVGLSGTPCRTSILEHFRQGCEPADLLHIVLLERNIETLVQAIGARNAADRDLVNKALAKSLVARDSLFNKIANNAAARDTRDALAVDVPSFGRLRDLVVAILQQP